MSATASSRFSKEAFFTYLMINMGLWVALTRSIDPQELIAGGVVALAAAWAGALVYEDKNGPLMPGSILSPLRLIHLLRFIAYLMWQIVLANWDVARRVISPAMPINPGIVKVKTELKSPLGRMILANAITLTPGTLTVNIEGDVLCVHWIDVESDDIEAATQTIVGDFEKYLEVIFG